MQHGQMAFHFRIYYQITYTTLVPLVNNDLPIV